MASQVVPQMATHSKKSRAFEELMANCPATGGRGPGSTDGRRGCPARCVTNWACGTEAAAQLGNQTSDCGRSITTLGPGTREPAPVAAHEATRTHARHLTSLFYRVDAEAHDDGQARLRRQLGGMPTRLFERRSCAPGDTGDRNVIDEAAGAAQNGGLALAAGGRRQERHDRQALGPRTLAQALTLVGGQVDDQDAVDAGVCHRPREALLAESDDGVVVAEEHDRRRVSLPERARHFERGP